MNFNERAREEANKYQQDSDFKFGSLQGTAKLGAYNGFIVGAEWGLRQAIEELRGEQAMQSSTAHGGDRGLAPMFWALWLEAKMELEKE